MVTESGLVDTTPSLFGTMYSVTYRLAGETSDYVACNERIYVALVVLSYAACKPFSSYEQSCCVENICMYQENCPLMIENLCCPLLLWLIVLILGVEDILHFVNINYLKILIRSDDMPRNEYFTILWQPF